MANIGVPVLGGGKRRRPPMVLAHIPVRAMKQFNDLAFSAHEAEGIERKRRMRRIEHIRRSIELCQRDSFALMHHPRVAQRAAYTVRAAVVEPKRPESVYTFLKEWD